MPEDILKRAAELEAKEHGSPVAESVLAIIKAGEHQKTINRLLAVVVALSIFLTLTVGAIGYQLLRTTQSVHAACIAGNEARANQVILWKGVVTRSQQNPDRPQTEKDKERAEEFLAFVEDTFAPRNCG